MSYIKCVDSVTVVYKQMSEKGHLMDKIKVITFFKSYNNSIFYICCLSINFKVKRDTYITIKEIINLLT